eukprot:6184546-Pleurochrysis_carterae.AAC.1
MGGGHRTIVLRSEEGEEESLAGDNAKPKGLRHGPNERARLEANRHGKMEKALMPKLGSRRCLVMMRVTTLQSIGIIHSLHATLRAK